MSGNELLNYMSWLVGGGMAHRVSNIYIFSGSFVRCCHVWWVQNGNRVRNRGYI